jgi:proprotein convertase subtilisin/kexin type 5
MLAFLLACAFSQTTTCTQDDKQIKYCQMCNSAFTLCNVCTVGSIPTRFYCEPCLATPFPNATCGRCLESVCGAGCSGSEDCTFCHRCCQFKGTCRVSSSVGLVECPPGEYVRDRACAVCPIECSECLSTTNCVSCRSSMFLQSGRCIGRCSDGYYEDTVNKKCVICRPSCSRCSGSGQFDCQRCAVGFIMTDVQNCVKCDRYYYVDEYNNAVCAGNCPLGYFLAKQDDGQNVCSVCLPSCNTCTTSTICLQCLKTYFL